MSGGARFGSVQNLTTREAMGTALIHVGSPASGGSVSTEAPPVGVPRPDTSAHARRSLLGIIVAIERHRRQTARLLYGLDDADRAVV